MEIVAHLRQVREEKAIRLEELAAYTHIRPPILKAIEEGRFEELPEPIYVQGFIRHYGDAMGLDGAALAKTVADICLTPQESNKDHQVLHEKPSIYVPLAVPYVLLLGAACFGLYYILNQQPSVESASQRKSSPVASKQKTESASKTASLVSSASSSKPKPSVPVSLATTKALSPQATTPSPSPTPSPTAQKTSPPVEVTLELQDKSWLRVKVDGKTEFEGELNKGDKKTWTAKKELIIRSGNAGAVLISTNKKQPTPLGSIDSVKQVTITPETANSQ
ncbi:helix-turn-helix domain-containing protein [Brasilonema sp. UFV-L1]|nr:RodZ domain-containing protein [Brasilonema sp. UFV-L1]NMG06104.1 helix-turn-helix domain-containing protein [Brasilonema sp. UFV-L1]